MLLHTPVHVVPDSPQYTRTMHVTLSVLRRVCEFSCSVFFPESVWAKGSSNSGGLFYINHFHIFTPTHIIFSSSHLLIFNSTHIIFSSSHLLFFRFFTSTHIIFSSSHLLIFTSTHHLLIFTSSHLHIFSSSHLHISSSHRFSSSHPLFFTSAHIIFTSSHLHILTSSLSPSPMSSFYLLSLGRGWCQRGAMKCNPFTRNEVQSAKNEVKLRFNILNGSPFAAFCSFCTKSSLISKNWGKIAI